MGLVMFQSVDAYNYYFYFIIVQAVILSVLAIPLWFRLFYVKVEQGVALIKNDMSPEPKVYFSGAFIYPVINMKELMKVSLITVTIDRKGCDGLICRDNIRTDITLVFYLKVNESSEAVLMVAKSLGSQRASDKQTVNDLFNAKFSEAMKTVAIKFEFVGLMENIETFRDRIIEVVGDDLNGYDLEDVAVDYLEQTPISKLEPDNVLGAEGIRKVTELTAMT